MSDVMKGHISTGLLDRYAAGDTGSNVDDAWWAVEAHLERCAQCRDRLGEAVARTNPATSVLLEQVREALAGKLSRSPRMPGRRRWLPGWMSRWAAPAMLPRLGMTVLVVLAALGLDLADAGRYPSLVLLLAPVAPLVAVAAAWSRGLDPAYELVASSPRAGFDLVLRRTAAVLVVVIPALAGAGWLAGASPALWLLPCLAFTTGSLALGELVGLHRAATGLALGWAIVVIGPSLVLAKPPALLAPSSLPGWAVVTAIVAIALMVRRNAYSTLESFR